MPNTPIKTVFQSDALIWRAARYGTPTGLGTTQINVDTTRVYKEHAYTNSFEIPSMPTNASDGTWDTITFNIKYMHVNSSNDPNHHNVGAFRIALYSRAGKEIQGDDYTIVPEYGTTSDYGEERPENVIGTFTGRYTATFTNIRPGTYYLHATEHNTGDGEAMYITASNGTAFEAVPCFAAGTLIETDAGLVPVESLEVGTLVRTCDNGLRPIRWVGSKKLHSINLVNQPKLRPIRIKSGALGPNFPSTDLIVSPQHRMLVRSVIAQRMFGFHEVLVAAKKLIEIDGIEVADDLEEVEYFHLMFDQHELVFANGALSESLYAGPEALKAIGSSALEELFSLFPELENELEQGSIAASARQLATGKMARKLVERHVKHGKMLVN